MRLYHYTGTDHVAGILRDGITLGGGIPLAVRFDGREHYQFIPGYRWLTTNEDWSAQSWATNLTHDCDRTAVRLSVVIPKVHRAHLLRCDDVVQALAEDFGAQLAEGWHEPYEWPGHETWYVFKGRIPSAWIRGLEHRPSGNGVATGTDEREPTAESRP